MATIRSISLGSVSALIVALAIQYAWVHLYVTEYCYTAIRTLSDDQPRANCFKVSTSGLFKQVYSKPVTTITTGIRDGYVLPGLIDGHGHILQYGELLNSVDLFQSKSLDEIRERLKDYIKKSPEEGTASSWIRGTGWDQAAFGGSMPTALDLDQDSQLKGKYIMLDRVDVHCVWVSQAVLDLLPKPLPDHVDGGEIVRQPGLGVFCDNAMDIVQAVYPKPGKEKKTQWIGSAMSSLNSFGIVGVHDAGVAPLDLDLYEEKAKTKEWTVRVYAMLECAVRNTICPEAARKISTTNDMFAVRSVKLFADGALGSWGSAMLEEYSDRPGDVGSLLVNASTLTSLAKSWAAADYQVNIHAIGDRANKYTIDALESALKEVCTEEGLSVSDCQATRRFRIEHAQIIHPDDQARMHSLGIIPSIQPTHATSDMAYAEDRIGKARTKEEAYRMQSLINLQPILGSDFPVEPANPFEGMYAAVNRRSPRTGLGRNGEDEGWHVEETLTTKEALCGFTVNPARGAFLEGKAGVIQDGAFADWIVLDQDIDKSPTEELRNVRVRETWVAGRQVYKRE
ncbi:hypothetical protein CLAFUW4_10385 [Fulvia fulva]|uniref:Amidohydrolase 3 domain-containing protein n=1 Tax=Passalora fulva TaxID=5499 RepID=A0A9Q8P715_PASFU|nr:uncharacterized protein CLAFUR5_05000 [Fulvia fulva]KAK4615676.1 hypothetical protein CLAFUR4_10389 [Fulvia fulva]KAK4617160.1 hypothetical protein CLAFUR0_10390 [Fulvia fulva]UJO15705.1 hypothetical protein CLAFUR5_05000 [Fulvia fulva]WPV19174.1 hypothetical protein CLAFUW4_10385 [Fulvia fulva]WPV34020.1 hypothetical protein CLAFUW7_10385 [Fulvia fulva]